MIEGFERRRLTRSRYRAVAGVCGGIADYFGWNPTPVRILYLLGSIFSVAFPGIIVYLMLWAVMPAPDQ